MMELSEAEIFSIEMARVHSLMDEKDRVGIVWLRVSQLSDTLKAFPGKYVRINPENKTPHYEKYVKGIDGLTGEFIVWRDVAAFKRR